MCGRGPPLLILLLLVAVVCISSGHQDPRELENEDLVFDHDNKLLSPNVRREQQPPESFFHSIWHWLDFDAHALSALQLEWPGNVDKQDSSLLKSINTRRKREANGGDKNKELEVLFDSQKVESKDDGADSSAFRVYRHGDDEDDVGSGEFDIENEIEVRRSTSETEKSSSTTTNAPTTASESNSVEQSEEFDERNVYRISMTIKEPYREEFERREDEKFQKFAKNLTKTVEGILHQHLKKDHHVTFVKMENAPDPFESHVHLDVHTMSSEADIRDTLERHINTYYSLGKFTVNPLTFRLRAVLECQFGEIACDVSRCILQTQRCDFKADCEDGSDEAGCKYPTCGPDDFMCNSGQCIPGNQRCDERPDCYDRSDEANCLSTCSPDEYRCLEGICISIDKRCNGQPDCRNGDDEESCGVKGLPKNDIYGCRSDEFECSRSYCISRLDVCNGRSDCPDGKDERNCPSYRHREEEPKRVDIKVYPVNQIIKERSEVVFQCRDEGPLRARVRWSRGNGRPLPPGSKTDNGRLEIPNIQLEHSGSYICEAEQYSYLPGARMTGELTVEKAAPTGTQSQKVCGPTEATCSNEECIPKQYICDGKPDCSDASDEVRCGLHGCEPNEFRCANKQCVSKVWRCDGDKDCTDGSDEENCEPSLPGSPCNYGEFRCASNDQCIPKSYHCDHERDCFDGSDEIGCSPVYIVKPPPPMVTLDPGDTLSLTCTAIGVPIPEVNWRLNWGHVPQKCSMSSLNGTGNIDCPDIRFEDQGAYSCEGINVMGFVIATPDTIVVVRGEGQVCPAGKFNSEAKRVEECLSCFCFGVATECSSANLFTYQIPLPAERFRVVPVELLGREIRIWPDANMTDGQLVVQDGHGLRLQGFNSEPGKNAVLYFGLPEHFHGNQLKSYGGHLRYNVEYTGNGINNDAPAVIVQGNDLTLYHSGAPVLPSSEMSQRVRFVYGEWYKSDRRGQLLASREDIMMVLANVNNILIKAQYENSPQLNVSITNVMLDSARSTGVDSAPFVEECRCPPGYTGLSCENCAPGYNRRRSGRWLGQCYREPTPQSCPRNYYGDPSRGINCQACPCPLPNQSDRTCHLDIDNISPKCDCPRGYEGKRCERCSEGYRGNPLRGEECLPSDQCDRSGSLSSEPDPYTRRCRCKEHVTGLKCDQCKPNTFSLAPANQFGCIGCFCMGTTNSCVSSNWYRSEIRVTFTTESSYRGFSLVGSTDRDASPIVSGISLKPDLREIVFNDFPDRGANNVYYWQLPSSFLGNQITAYGGNLKYVVRYVPSPGGMTSRNSAADVELISTNDITLLYFTREFPDPNSFKTFTVPLLEQYWQRSDGTKADREHLLMALADVEAIRIKATYTTHTYEAALSSVSLDIAKEYNTGNQRAIEVEKCSCPVGYQGLSCEDCAVGYTRADEGLYLGICEPCRCNGHSHQCDPENGICENCADHTTGENCEVCESGYDGDAKRGTPDDCQLRNGSAPLPCKCNPVGSLDTNCHNGFCRCKRNVDGPDCSRCKPSTFGLSQSNPDGCNECFCSGVTNVCHESSLYVTEIPFIILDNIHGFTLTDSSRREVVDGPFEVNVAVNEIGYKYSPADRNKRLFWSLPNSFTGNKVKSYGGKLMLTQNMMANPGSTCRKDQDIILIGNGITLYWTNPKNIKPDSMLMNTVLLRESEWHQLSPDGLRRATRSDLMNLLANIDAILVRATHCDDMIATYISDVSLETASESLDRRGRADQVEVCRCPPGYVGTSCESCAPGYYRNSNDRSSSTFGSCSRCPCNNNEQSCELDWSGQVRCNCNPQYTGQHCDRLAEYDPSSTQAPTPTTDRPSPIIVRIREPRIRIAKIGDSVRYHCSATSLTNNPVTVEWEKEGGYLPLGRSTDDSNGFLIIREVQVSDSGNYICRVTDGVHVQKERVTLNVGDSMAEPVVNISPPYLKVVEGEPVEFRCEVSGPTQALIEWIRPDGRMGPNVVLSNGILRIASASPSDAAEYRCIVRTHSGVTEKSTQLHVRGTQSYVPGGPGSQPPPELVLLISPAQWSGFSGDTVRLMCNASQPAQRIAWTRSERLSLPPGATQRDGLLTIANPAPGDAGWYVCTATLADGTEAQASANVNLSPRHEMPVVSVEPRRQKVPQGTSVTIQCRVGELQDESELANSVRWIKSNEPSLGANVVAQGPTLRISNVQMANRGFYICRYSPSGRNNYEATAMVDVEPRVMPVVEVFPQHQQTVLEGSTVDFHCRSKAGIPTPEIRWTRQDGGRLGPNTQIMSGGVLRINNVTRIDAGQYVCVAENPVGVTSATVSLEVHSLPVINILPQRGVLVLKSGEPLHLSCSATGHPQPTVSWSKDYNSEQPVIDPYETGTSGPTASIDINSVSVEDEGTYICKANSLAGGIEDYVQLRIEDDGNSVEYPENCRGDTPCPHPSEENSNIRPSPEQGNLEVDRSTNVPSGGKVSMKCKLFPYPDDKNIILDWRRENGRPMPRFSTVNDGTLFLTDLKREDSGFYTCFGVDPNGRQLFSARTQLNVIDIPKVELRPVKQTVRPGESPSIHCIATGEQPMSVQWEAVGRTLPPSVSQTNGVLQFYGIAFSDAGKYVCKATNSYGTAESVAEVSVEASSSPIVRVQASKNPAYVGDSVELYCVTSGIVNPRYVWSMPLEVSLPHNARESGNILNLIDVQLSNSGIYRCAINSEEGFVEGDIDLRVQGDSDSATDDTYDKPLEIKYVSLGKNIELSCRDHLQPLGRYRWTRTNGSLPIRHELRDNVLILNEVDVDAAGTYICKGNNGQESIETFTTVVVTGLVPHFNQAPLSFIELPPLDAYLRFDIELSFRPEYSDGVLLYTSEFSNEYGDFLSLTLENGVPVFRFDLGSGPVVVQADRPITLRNWHTIRLKRDRKEVEMIMDDQYSYQSSSKGKKDGLDLHLPLYVGGVADNVITNKNAGLTNGFVGCMNALTINGKQINLMSNMVMSQSITSCEICENLDNPCMNGVCQESTSKAGYECLCNIGFSGPRCQTPKQSCQPGICGDGSCIETDTGYDCDCPIGKTGPNCEYSQMIRTPRLSHARSYLAYTTPKSLRRNG